MILRKLAIIFLCFGCSQSLFVPEQLTTLLSFIYTNIPPIRKGTDSRVGFGFRLGPNADFQVMLELGPQENTLPIGPAGNAKRQIYNEEEYRPDDAYGATGQENWGEKDGDAYQDSGPPKLDQDIINHLRQLYKPQKKEAGKS